MAICIGVSFTSSMFISSVWLSLISNVHNDIVHNASSICIALSFF